MGEEELARRLRQAVAELPETDREILLMRNFEGLSNREAAQVLGLEPATASRRYGRAILRLRKVLQAGGVMGSES
jgi:RNA polymerase sigma factor (sigma-70 family)